MAIYKPSLLDKFKDFVNGLKSNWDIFESHQAENASKHITESGSNDDGYYIKFDDGTMICTKVGTKTWAALKSEFGLVETANMGVGGGKLWYGDWLSPPRAFVGDYVLSAQGGRSTASTWYLIHSEFGFGKFNVSVSSTPNDTTSLTIGLIGVGRWK